MAFKKDIDFNAQYAIKNSNDLIFLHHKFMQQLFFDVIIKKYVDFNNKYTIQNSKKN